VTDDSTPPNVAQREFTLQMPPNSPTPNTPAPSGAAAATDTVDLFASVRYPTTSSLRDELNAIANRPKATTAEANQEPDAQPDNGSFTTVLGTFDLGLRRALAYAAAAAPLPQAGGGKLATNTAVTSAHGDAYELGVRLANLCLAAETGEPGFTALFTTTGQTDVGAPDTYRIHALLGSLRDSFPSAAAHAVSRNIEDWSAWVQGYPVDTAASNFDSLSGDAGFTACQAAMQAQGKVWESILTGQSRGRDYLTLASYPDAADHLLVAWTGILDSMARTLRKTIFGRTLLILLGVGALLVAFAIAVSFLKTQNPSGAEKTVITVGGVIAALGAAAGIHVNRTQLNSVVSKAWLLAESVLIDSEVIEAIAIATRRLPGEGLEGTAGSRQRTFLSKYRQATAKAHPTKPHRANKTGRTSRLRQAEHKPEENPLALIDSTS